jgi:hypothetical protein
MWTYLPMHVVSYGYRYYWLGVGLAYSELGAQALRKRALAVVGWSGEHLEVDFP